jgi:hypothetical protein
MSNELGTLVVVVLKARNLNDKHSFHKQDVFAQIALNGPPKRTTVDIKGGQHPVWDEEVRISVSNDPSEKNRTLEVSCWAKERKVDDLLGQGKVDITETLQTGEFDGTLHIFLRVGPFFTDDLDWVKLETDGGYRGDVFLEMTFYANAPAPLSRRASRLDPRTRLARPTQPYKYPNLVPPSLLNPNKLSPRRDPNQPLQTPPKGNNLVPPSSRSASSSPKACNDVLPSVSEDLTQLPVSLTASGGAANIGVKRPDPPSMLRPGNPKSSPIPIGSSHASAPEYGPHSQSQTGYHQPAARAQTSGLPNPYVNSGSVAPFASLLRAQTAGQPNRYENPSTFPISALGNAHVSIYDTQYNHHLSQELVFQPSTRPAASSDLPDPYLTARYQQPLPLPGSSPPRQQSAPRDPAAQAAEIRRQALSLEEQDREKRKEQEEADAALARQLDLELNLGDSEQERRSSDGGHMPGDW